MARRISGVGLVTVSLRRSTVVTRVRCSVFCAVPLDATLLIQILAAWTCKK
jgi:hypothetical protein